MDKFRIDDVIVNLNYAKSAFKNTYPHGLFQKVMFVDVTLYQLLFFIPLTNTA